MLLSHYMMSPREGRLQQVYHIFAYLKQFYHSMLIYDDSDPPFSNTSFHTCDWTSHYPDAAEQIQTNIPEAFGHSIVTTCYVEADHAGCKATRRLYTGINIYVNKAPIVWFSKHYNTVESSTFGSEFIALKTAIDLIEALRYKLRVFGFPLGGPTNICPTNIFCDNKAVVLNSTHP
jgi:hypothetical protein